MSPTSATLFSLNLSKMSNKKGVKDGPMYNQSLGEMPVLPSLQDVSTASNTFVFSASMRTTV